ncbi:MAG TPA: flagellin [Acidisoma sp.]|jgi:flagellin|uniref:flagellin N-terminal helical domain-containing protein n=1 Tax=Acidisoma sp. TaxID=1872115 RepID=UPI002C09ED47|nr:flagellin [Acidisoma sp.]HTI00225.1 flagellin [Acidisoma sp.]
MSAIGSILTNQGALNALNSISQTSNTNNNLEQQLSSGLSINSPADNPAGYITAQGFTSQLNGLTQAISNANQGVSLLQTAQGALQQQIGVTQQLNSIAVQAANGTQSASDRQSLQSLVTQLNTQITNTAAQTQFNGVSLLDGTFSNVQFQVGAYSGQTLSLSIGNTAANSIGINQSSASATVYNTEKGVLSNIASAAATTGAFTAGTVKFTGNNGNTGSLTVAANSSAAGLATSINALSSKTGISAQAVNTTTLKAANATPGSGFAFKIQGSGSTTQTINAATVSALAAQINGQTGTTGITATVSSGSGSISLTQANGKNIKITAVTAGSLTASGQGTATTLKTGAGTASGIIQGQVEFQSSAAFSLSGGSSIGLNGASKLTSLSQINVTTSSGADSAINIVKFALQGLNSQGGVLGAAQQRLTATIANLNTSSQNVTSALGVVQDANIPQVSNQLTQAQIQAQAGVAALKSSTTLQQSYLSLLP